MRKHLIIRAVAIACLLAMAGCSKAANESEPGKAKEGLEVGNKFPHYDTFAAKTIDGKQLKLSDYKGTLLFIDFWASWCAPCLTELPYLKVVQDTYVGDEFTILGISLDQRISDLREMAEGLGLEYPQLCDEKGWRSKYATTFSIRSIPTNFLLDGDGIIVAKNLRGLSVAGQVAKGLGRDEAVVHYAKAMDHLTSSRTPDMEKAKAELDKALEADPEQPEFHFLAAQMSLQAKDFDAAIEHFETGLEHRDKLPVFLPALYAYVGLGHAHLQNGDKDKAVKAIEDVIEAINALDDDEKEPYARYLPQLKQLKADWGKD